MERDCLTMGSGNLFFCAGEGWCEGAEGVFGGCGGEKRVGVWAGGYTLWMCACFGLIFGLKVA